MGTEVGVRIHCFGRVRILADHVELDLSTGQRQLVATLAAAGPDGLDADQLYEELFQDRPAGSGRQAAVMRVQRLRNKLPSNALTKGGQYGFDPATCSVDLWQFRDHADAGDTSAALDLWAPPFTGIEEPTPRLQVEQEQLRRRRRQVLAEQGWRIRPSSGERWMSQILEELDDDPYNEDLTASAAGALYRLGRQTEALDLIQRYRRALLDRHGLDIGRALHEVELAILRHDGGFLASRDGAGASGLRLVPATEVGAAMLHDRSRFVGRNAELEALNEVLRGEQTAGIVSPSIALVVGAGGVGKTHTVAKALEALAAEGVRIRIGSAGGVSDGSDQAAYGVLIRAIPELNDALRRMGESTDLETARSVFWYEVDRMLGEIVEREPTVIVLEDVHQADSQSQMILRHLAAAGLPSGLRLVLTARPMAPSTSWATVVESLVASPRLVMIQLEPLTQEDVAALVDADHPDEPLLRRRQFAGRVSQISGGNALVASVLSRDAPEGLDMSTLPSELTPEASLAAHLESTIDDADLADLLTVAALVGFHFQPRLVASVLGLDPQYVDAQLGEAERLGLCRPVGDDRWQFEHLLFVACLVQRMRLVQPVLYARLAQSPNVSDEEIVRYIVGAGQELDSDWALDRLLEAATIRERNLAFSEAATALRAALAHLPDTEEAATSVLIRLASCANRSGALDEAREYRKDAWARAVGADDHDAMAQVALAGLPSGESIGGEPDRLEMLGSLDKEKVVSFSPAELTWSHIRQARLCDRFDTAAELVADVDPAWQAQDPEGWRGLRLETLMLESVSPRATPIRAELTQLADDAPTGALRSEIRFRELVAALIEQDPEAAGPLFDRVAEEIDGHGSPRTRWSIEVMSVALGDIGMRETELDPDSTRESGIRWGIPDVFDSWGVHLWMRSWLGERYDEALAMTAIAEAQFADNLAWKAGAALCNAHLGDRAAAAAGARRVAGGIRRSPDGNWTPVCAALLAETAFVADLPQAAEAARDYLLPRSGQAVLLGICAAHFGPADRFLGLCESVLDSADARATLERAHEQALASGAEWWARRAEEDLAGV